MGWHCSTQAGLGAKDGQGRVSRVCGRPGPSFGVGCVGFDLTYDRASGVSDAVFSFSLTFSSLLPLFEVWYAIEPSLVLGTQC